MKISNHSKSFKTVILTDFSNIIDKIYYYIVKVIVI